VKYVDKLPEKLLERTEILIDFFRTHSKEYYQMLNIHSCGEGGESKVLIGDVPSANIVLKIPLNTNQNSIESAIEETHLIEFMYDWKGYRDCVVEPLEELIVR